MLDLLCKILPASGVRALEVRAVITVPGIFSAPVARAMAEQLCREHEERMKQLGVEVQTLQLAEISLADPEPEENGNQTRTRQASKIIDISKRRRQADPSCEPAD